MASSVHAKCARLYLGQHKDDGTDKNDAAHGGETPRHRAALMGVIKLESA